MDASKYASGAHNTAHDTAQNQSLVVSQDSSTTEAAPLPTEVPDMGAFAQTRPPEDLFSDDFTPLARPVVETAGSVIPTGPRRKSTQSQQQRPPHRKSQPQRNARKPSIANSPLSPSETIDSTSPQSNKPNAHTQSVRGDRSATGGAAKSKLTDEELNAKMQEMKVKNTELEQAHARSRADEESFRANEAAAKERQRQDRANRQVMLSERERNAQRKMQAQQGRDWDTAKQEVDIVDRPQRRPMRGAHGGVSRDPVTATTQTTGILAQQDSPSSASISNRGGGRGGRGRGRGRGDFRGESSGNRQINFDNHTQALPGASDFPSLNESTPKTNPKQSTAKFDTSANGNVLPTSRTDSFGAVVTTGEKTSWADQMYDTPDAGWEDNAREQKAPKGGW